jgi:uncharacterized membrane protein
VSESRRQLLSIGVFLLIIVAVILLFATSIIAWTLVIPGMRASNPQKYERGAFSTMGLGLLMIAVGGAWYLFGINWLYSLAVILLVLGALAMAAALKRK